MKDIDKDTQQSLDLDSNEIYNQLWLELEPKLKRPRRSRKIFLIFFCLFSISCFVVFYNWLADNKISTVERISVANADELSSKVAINNIEFQNNILQNVNNDKVDLLEVNVQNLSDSSNNKFNEQNTKPKSFLGNLNTVVPVNAVDEYRNESTNTINQDLFSDYNKGSNKPEVQLGYLLKKQKSINQLNLENYLLPFDKEDYQIDPPSMNMFQAELNSIKGVKVDRTPWYLSIDISYLHPFEKEANNGNSYSKALDNSLSWDSGIGVELATYYQLTSYLEIGLGINYTKLFERFRLKNEIVVEHIVVNPEAFLYRGTYIEAEQCVETIITQDIANNNSLNRFFLIPKLAGVFYLGEFRIRSGVGVPISLYQNYSGILFDTSDLRIHDGDIFDERKYSIIGLQLSNSISRHISQAVEIGLKFNYSRFGSTDVDDRIYNRNTLNVIDIGISGTYHF